MAACMSDVPVLLLLFNRPGHTRRLLQALRAVRPTRLYVAADGPRPTRPAEAELCREVRRCVEAVDWPCTVQRLYREENLGCRRAVSEALTWFFAAEPEGIILEDDCVPAPDFFRFAALMLERFRKQPQVFAVQGNCFTTSVTEASYYFSRNFFMWGWATWADRWHAVRLDDEYLRQLQESDFLRDWPSPRRRVGHYWRGILARLRAGEFDSWGYPTTFNCFARRQYNVTPTVNLVSNIGFGQESTHTADIDVGPLNHTLGRIPATLLHPQPWFSPQRAFEDENRWRIGLGLRARLRHFWLRVRARLRRLRRA